MWKDERLDEGRKRSNGGISKGPKTREAKEGANQENVGRNRGYREDEDGDELCKMRNHAEPVGDGMASVRDASVEGGYPNVEVGREANDI